MLESLSLAQLTIGLGIEEPHRVPAFRLRPLHGGVGIGNQVSDRIRVTRENRDAHAGCNAQTVSHHSELIAKVLENLCGQLLRSHRLWPRADKGKLVAAHARYKGFVRSIGQALRHGAQHAISDSGSEQIIDLLEVVEAAMHDRKLLSGSPCTVDGRPQVEF